MVNSAISGLKKISTPGLRVYKGADSLPRVLSGLGIAIISTSKGLLTDKRSQKKSNWWRSCLPYMVISVIRDLN